MQKYMEIEPATRRLQRERARGRERKMYVHIYIYVCVYVKDWSLLAGGLYYRMDTETKKEKK